MGRYKTGQVVNVGGIDLGIIIAESAEPKNHWTVVLRKRDKKGNVAIATIEESDIEPYTRFCWKCGKADLNSDKHPTCDICGWIKCPECSACKQCGCESYGVSIYQDLKTLEEMIPVPPGMVRISKDLLDKIVGNRL